MTGFVQNLSTLKLLFCKFKFIFKLYTYIHLCITNIENLFTWTNLKTTENAEYVVLQYYNGKYPLSEFRLFFQTSKQILC